MKLTPEVDSRSSVCFMCQDVIRKQNPSVLETASQRSEQMLFLCIKLSFPLKQTRDKNLNGIFLFCYIQHGFNGLSKHCHFFLTNSYITYLSSSYFEIFFMEHMEYLQLRQRKATYAKYQQPAGGTFVLKQ